MPEIEKHLVLSTGHIHKEDAEKLNNEMQFPSFKHTDSRMSFCETEYGWTLFVNFSQPTEHTYPWDVYSGTLCGRQEEKWKTDFNAISDMAREFGCKYVTFDRDGPLEDNLKQYDW